MGIWGNSSKDSEAHIPHENTPYIVVEVVLAQKMIKAGSQNLHELEHTMNEYFSKGYRLHTMNISINNGVLGGDQKVATLVFERNDVR